MKKYFTTGTLFSNSTCCFNNNNNINNEDSICNELSSFDNFLLSGLNEIDKGIHTL